jgi:hypothetical protein
VRTEQEMNEIFRQIERGNLIGPTSNRCRDSNTIVVVSQSDHQASGLALPTMSVNINCWDVADIGTTSS